MLIIALLNIQNRDKQPDKVTKNASNPNCMSPRAFVCELTDERSVKWKSFFTAMRVQFWHFRS